MCLDPATMAIASFALTAASTGAGLYAQNQQTHAQEDANQKQYDAAMKAYRENLANIEVTRNQALSDATQKLNENNKAARAAEATVTVAAGEGGVSGLSVDALLRDLAGKAGYDNTNVEENYLRQNQALNAKRENVYNSTSSDINQLQTPQAPDYLGAVFRLGSAGLSSYSNYRREDAILRGVRTG